MIKKKNTGLLLASDSTGNLFLLRVVALSKLLPRVILIALFVKLNIIYSVATMYSAVTISVLQDKLSLELCFNRWLLLIC